MLAFKGLFLYGAVHRKAKMTEMKRAWQFLLDNLNYENCIVLLREYNKIVGELLFHYAGEIRTIPVQIGGTSWELEMPHTGIIIDELKKIEQMEDGEQGVD